MPVAIVLWDRNGFPSVQKVLDQVLGNMRATLAPGHEIDINNVALRLTLDINGLVGFATDFGTTRSFNDTDSDELFFILTSCKRLCSLRRSRLAAAFFCWVARTANITHIFLLKQQGIPLAAVSDRRHSSVPAPPLLKVGSEHLSCACSDEGTVLPGDQSGTAPDVLDSGGAPQRSALPLLPQAHDAAPARGATVLSAATQALQQGDIWCPGSTTGLPSVHEESSREAPPAFSHHMRSVKAAFLNALEDPRPLQQADASTASQIVASITQLNCVLKIKPKLPNTHGESQLSSQPLPSGGENPNPTVTRGAAG